MIAGLQLPLTSLTLKAVALLRRVPTLCRLLMLYRMRNEQGAEEQLALVLVSFEIREGMQAAEVAADRSAPDILTHARADWSNCLFALQWPLLVKFFPVSLVRSACFAPALVCARGTTESLLLPHQPVWRALAFADCTLCSRRASGKLESG